MKVTLSQQDLTHGLNQVTRALSSRVQLPVLSNVLINVDKKGVSFAATNLEIGIRCSYGGQVEEEGSITIPARPLAEYVSNISDPKVTLETQESKLSVSGGKFQATFSGIDASEFPVLPKRSSTGQSISSQLLSQIASQVAYAAAVDESRPVLTGVRFVTNDSSLVIVATDGFRLSRKEINLESESKSSFPGNLILPAKTILEVAKIVSETKEETVTMDSVEKNNQVIFSCGDVDLISRVLEGNYPDTEKIIPADLPVQVTVDRQEFVKSLKAASIFARENNNIVRFEIRDSKFEIKSQSSQSGESGVTMEADNTGEGEISFNYKFVADVLGSFSSERITLQMKDHLSPGVFRPEKEESLLALVMPVRI